MRALAALVTLVALAGCLTAPAVDDAAPGAGGPLKGASHLNGTAPPLELTVHTTGVYPVDPRFDPGVLDARAGVEVRVTLVHSDALPTIPHDWVLESVNGAATEAVSYGGTRSVTFTAPAPGEYEYYCSVGDHRERGMVGTFIVRGAP